MLPPGHCSVDTAVLSTNFLSSAPGRNFCIRRCQTVAHYQLQSTRGIPNRQTIFFHTNRMTSLSLMEAKASASIHLLKLSDATKTTFSELGW